MAVSFTKFPWSLWLGGKEKEQVSNVSGGGGGGGGGVNLFPDLVGLREPENLRFRSVLGAKKMASSSSSSSRKVRTKWKSREDRRRNRIDKEYDVVLVPSDGVCLSGSESDDSDWSVGWLEPHAPGFQSDDDEGDNSFAVLVPCYRHEFKLKDEGDFEEETSNQFLSAVMNLPNDYSSEGKKYMVQWLSSLQNF